MSIAKKTAHWLEYNFWSLIIPWMSESPYAKKIVNLGARAVWRCQPLPILIRYSILAVIALGLGLSLGYFLGYMI